MRVSDYFAELFVAGRLADAGWNVYFPHRDHGFDFIISRPIADGTQLLRPVQVKGKYATSEKTDKVTYGYVGELTQLHPEMVLAIPCFTGNSQGLPVCTAYMPLNLIRPHQRGFRCEPASFKGGVPVPRLAYKKFFDAGGIQALAEPSWKNSTIVAADATAA